MVCCCHGCCRCRPNYWWWYQPVYVRPAPVCPPPARPLDTNVGRAIRQAREALR